MAQKLRRRREPEAEGGGAEGNVGRFGSIDSEDGRAVSRPTNWMKDVGSLSLLLLLYTLQGIPMGLSGSIPFLLQKRISWTQQGTFSMVTWPFSLKLFWAPLVDAIFVPSFGRRKSWLVPVQLLCGGLMLWAQYRIDGWLGELPDDAIDATPSQAPAIGTLTAYFLVLFFLMATQDIAVDGWALTMLRKENRGLASTMNSVGQTLGYFTAYVGFLALNDADTCNSFFRSEPRDEGLVSLGGFVAFWGYVFIATTLYVVFFKKEKPVDADTPVEDVRGTYVSLWKVLTLPAVRQLVVVLLTCRAAFAAADAATSLKIVEYGMPKEDLAFLTTLLGAVGVVLPAVLGHLTAGRRPLDSWRWAYPLRLVVGLIYGVLVPLSAVAYGFGAAPPGHAPGGGGFLAHWSMGRSGFCLVLVVGVLLHEVAATAMFVSQMAFFAHVSDPVMGGTYMTLLNTVSNLGSKWPNMASLYLMDPMTKWKCHGIAGIDWKGREGTPCASATEEWCSAGGGQCLVSQDAYFTQLMICTGIGLLWMAFFLRKVHRLQGLKDSAWKVGSGLRTLSIDP